MPDGQSVQQFLFGIGKMKDVVFTEMKSAVVGVIIDDGVIVHNNSLLERKI